MSISKSMNARLNYFDPDVPGLRSLLLQQDSSTSTGFAYYADSPLNIVLYGPPGAGKSIFALQMAVAAARRPHWRALYFTKDTPSPVLRERVAVAFNGFERAEEEGKVPAGSEDGGGRQEAVTAVATRGATGNIGNDGSAGDERSTSLATQAGASPKPNSATTQGDTLSPGTEIPQSLPANEKSGSEKGAVRTGGGGGPPLLLLQDELKALLSESGTDAEVKGRLQKSFLGFADFTDAPVAAAGLDRYAMAHSHCESLNYFCPKLRPVFDVLQETIDPMNAKGGLFVVCDSLSPKALESHLRLQTRFGQDEDNQNADVEASLPQGVIRLFIMESTELPAGLEVAFPPDIEIKMGIREDSHGVSTRTIRLLKTRFQNSLDEETPFIVLGTEESKNAAWHKRLSVAEDVLRWEQAPHTPFFKSRPGIEIMPPLIHEPIPTPQEVVRSTGFGIKELDELTEPSGLTGGGCTLLVTESRCGATALSLHYLLAEGFRRGDESVTLVNFGGDVAEILHTIWRHPQLRKWFWPSNTAHGDPTTPKGRWEQLNAKLSQQLPGGNPRHRLYSLPLLDDQGKPSNASFHIYIPDFTWVTAEEAMDRLRDLLDSESPQVSRLVLNRVGRVPARWPLIQNQSIFVSSLVAYCAKRPAEMLLIDDTATTHPGTGSFESRWAGLAQSVLRLRRLPFHGGETVSLELIRASGRRIKRWRPHEVVFEQDASGFGHKLHIRDEFRGYTGLQAGRPEHCKVLVELSYDVTRTPLHREVVTTKGSLEAAMDQLTVRLLSPGTWSGINSAFHNLSSVARDTCHVVSIDGIWLKNLLEQYVDVLHKLNDVELEAVLPKHVTEAAKEKAKADRTVAFEDAIADEYTTRSLDTAIAQVLQTVRDEDKEVEKSRLGTGIRFALPMRHNWGVLAVAQPSSLLKYPLNYLNC